MISDEMRELLSAYADGELDDDGRARAEALLAGDARLRRELAAYRRVGPSLRAWDAVDHRGGPSAAMSQRVLARVRAAGGGRGRGGAGGMRPLLAHPLAMAAGLLVACGLGFLLSHRPAPPRTLRAPELAAQAEIKTYPALRMAPLPVMADPVATVQAPEGPFDIAEAIRRERGLCERAETLRHEWAADEERWKAEAARRPAERRTGAANPEAAALVLALDFRNSAVEALLCVHGMGASAAPAVVALPPGRRVALDSAAGPGRVLLRGETPSLALLGEVLVAEGVGAGRTRIVTASHYVARSEFAPVTWADEIAPPADGTPSMLQVQPWMLGPRARQRLLSASDGRDPEFLRWLRDECKGRSLAEHLADKAGVRERAVARLVEALRADAGATGFAVFAGDALQGVEIFASHELMMQFAPRLLHGYLLEAGSRPLRLAAPGAGAAGLLTQAKRLIEELPGTTARFDDSDDQRGTREGWPEGLRRVLLRDGTGNILGAGLLVGDRPLHVTVYGASSLGG